MKITLALAVIGSSVLAVLTMQPAVAISNQGPVAEFYREFPDMSPSESRAALEEIAGLEAKSIDQVAREHLTIALSARAGGRVSAASSSGNVIKKGRLINAQNSGDSFYSDSSTMRVNHGHTGLYVTSSSIAEAPGGALKTRIVPANGVPVSNAVRLSIKATRSQRDNAIDWAKRHLNVAYNNNFAYNHKVEFHVYNCSQFVWASYKQLGIDLDGDGGLGVYPADIRDSNNVVRY